MAVPDAKLKIQTGRDKPHKARKGDLVAIERTTRDYTIGQGSQERTEVQLAMVESVDRNGIVKSYRTVGWGDELVSDNAVKIDPIREKTLVGSQDRVDVRAALEAAKQHTWPDTTQPKAYDSVEEAARVAKRFELKEGDARRGPVVDESTPKGLRVGDRVRLDRGSNTVEVTIIGRAEETTRYGNKALKLMAKLDDGKEGAIFLKPTDKVKVISRAPKDGATSRGGQPELVDDLLAREIRESYQRLATSRPVAEEALRDQVRRDFPRGSRGASDTERMISQLAKRGDISLATEQGGQPDDDETTRRLALANSREQDAQGMTFSQRVAQREGDKIRDARSVAALDSAPDNPKFTNFTQGAMELDRLTVAEAQLPDGKNDANMLRNLYGGILSRIDTVKRQGPARQKSKDQYYRPMTGLLEEAAQFVHQYDGNAKVVAKLRALADLYRPEGDKARPLRSRADIDAERATIAAQREARSTNLDKARAVQAEQRTEELTRSTEPKDNAAKVKAIQDGTLHSADLYRTIMSGPSGQRSHVFVGRVRYTPDRQHGEFEVIDTNSGERAGWMSRTVRDGEQMYVLHAEDYDGGIRLVGWTDTVSYGADVLVNGSSRASTRGTLDARRLSGGKFEAYVPKSLEQFDREMEAREQQADAVRAARLAVKEVTTPPATPATPARAALVGSSVEASAMRKGDVIESISGNKRTVSYVDDQGRAHFAEGGRTIPGGRYKVLSVADEPAPTRANNVELLDTPRAKPDDGGMTAPKPPAYAIGQRVEVQTYNFDKPGHPLEWFPGTVTRAEPIGDPTKGRWDLMVETDDGKRHPQVIGPRGGGKNIRTARS